MAEPRIQYAQTTDGVNIAFWTLGEGVPPLVQMPVLPFSHCQGEWQLAEMRNWYERLAEKRMVVRYDSRGFGSSQRDVSDYSLEANVRDLEAVANRLGLERFALWSSAIAGPMAIAYTAQHPERVSHLLLWCTWAGASDFYRSPRARALRATRDADWEMYIETVAHAARGWSEVRESEPYAALVREGATEEAARAAMDAAYEFDATALLPQVKALTLVLHRRQAPYPHVDVARGLASGIPNARLAVLEGSALAPTVGDTAAVLSAIDEFLGEGEETAVTTELPEGMAVILFADIADSTALTEQIGDAAFRNKARELDASLRTVIRECSGTPVEGKLVGDGVLAVFTSARQAIECALRCKGAGESVGLQLHLGIHAGDVIREGNNVYGGAVNIAARIAGASAPGEVLVSDTVRGLARTSAGVTFEDRREHELKGVGEPQRLFAVRGGADG
jgi:class 3 adenylate cyclase